jgi:hypothetical protein
VDWHVQSHQKEAEENLIHQNGVKDEVYSINIKSKEF